MMISYHYATMLRSWCACISYHTKYSFKLSICYVRPKDSVASKSMLYMCVQLTAAGHRAVCQTAWTPCTPPCHVRWGCSQSVPAMSTASPRAATLARAAVGVWTGTRGMRTQAGVWRQRVCVCSCLACCKHVVIIVKGHWPSISDSVAFNLFNMMIWCLILWQHFFCESVRTSNQIMLA